MSERVSTAYRTSVVLGSIPGLNCYQKDRWSVVANLQQHQRGQQKSWKNVPIILEEFSAPIGPPLKFDLIGGLTMLEDTGEECVVTRQPVLQTCC